ncbi:MAG: hypothetical protein ACYCX2_01735 [Christensenellales bacterium]
MANCTICGREAESSQPMVLVGSRRFEEGNGQGWGGSLDKSIRLWRTLALLSIGVCADCIQQNKKRKIRKNLIAAAVFFLAGLAFLTNPKALTFSIILGAIGGIILLSLLRFKNYKYGKAAPETVLRHYMITGTILQKDVLAVLDETLKGKDIPIKDTWYVIDPLNDWDKDRHFYDLALYSKEDLNQIGVRAEPSYPNGMKRNTKPQGEQQAIADAKALFEMTGAQGE